MKALIPHFQEAVVSFFCDRVGNFTVLQRKQAGQMTNLAAQGTPCEAQEKKVIVPSLEARSDSAARLQNSGSYMQEDNMEGQSSIRAQQL